jgi:acetophenone carboxylase
LPTPYERDGIRYLTGPHFLKGPGIDPEILERTGLEPLTELELRRLAELTDVEVDLFQHKLGAIVDEARTVFQGVCLSAAQMAGDVGTAIFTASGDMVAISTGVYFHAVLNYGAIKYIQKYYRDDPTVGVRDGDIFFYNEALSGVTHPYDMFVAMPVFWKGELVAWAAVGGHQGENGSKDPGGFAPTAATKYEEGLRITPLKIGEHFQIKTDHLNFMANHVRNPMEFILDLKSRVAVCERIRFRLEREIAKRGVDFVAAGFRKVLVSSAETARRRLRAYNDGRYRAVLFLDTIGVADALLRMPVEVEKRDDRLTIDFTGASPEHGVGPFHIHWHTVRAACAAFLFPYVFRGIPFNAGLFEPVRFLVPAGSWMNASQDAAHGFATTSSRLVVQTVHAAAIKMLFDSDQREAVGAPLAGGLQNDQWGGRDEAGHGYAESTAAANGAGQGARWDADGEYVMNFFWTSEVDLIGVEELEAKFPWLFLSRNTFQRDLQGYGRFNGGVGLGQIMKLHKARGSFRLTTMGIGYRLSADPGIFGGYWGRPVQVVIVRRSKVNELLSRGDPRLPTLLQDLVTFPLGGECTVTRPNFSGLPVDEDTVLAFTMGSGGGYGDPLERDPSRVSADVRAGFISAETARRVFGVALDTGGGEVDERETAQLRREEREVRKRQGVPLREFLRTWSTLRPPEEILRFYGPWPDPGREGYSSHGGGRVEQNGGSP